MEGEEVSVLGQAVQDSEVQGSAPPLAAEATSLIEEKASLEPA